jgi:hypothetical protein
VNSICVCPYLDEGRTVWRAIAGDFDGLTIGSLHSAITITSACVEMHQSTDKDSKIGKDAPVGLTPDERPN